MELHGGNLVTGDVARRGPATLRGVDPATGLSLDPAFHEATEGEVAQALEAAEAAFPAYARQPAERIAAFLDAIAAGLEALGPPLLARAGAETGLPEA